MGKRSVAPSQSPVVRLSAAVAPANSASDRPTARPTDTKLTDPPVYVPVSVPASCQFASPNVVAKDSAPTIAPTTVPRQASANAPTRRGPTLRTSPMSTASRSHAIASEVTGPPTTT